MIRNLAGLRFVFIVLIFLSHMGAFGLSTFDFGGDCGVALFFMLSGFVLAHRYGGEISQGKFCQGKFMRRQLAKTYPLHIVLTAAIVLTSWQTVDWAYAGRLVPTLVLLQSWIPDKSFFFMCNGVSWFLCDIFFAYAMFPLLYKVAMQTDGNKLALLANVALVLYAMCIIMVPRHRAIELIYVQPLLRCADFALGIALYRLLPIFRRLVKTDAQAATAELSAIAISIATYAIFPMVDSRIGCAALFWPMSAACIMAFTVSDNHHTALTRLLQSRCMQALGSMTFELYLTHTFVSGAAFLALRKLGISLPPLPALLVYFVATLAASWMAKTYITSKAFSALTKQK